MKNNQKKREEVAQQPNADSVSAIRDIIFGQQMVDYEGRFEELEKALTTEINRVEKKLDKGIADITALLEKETNNLGEKKVDRTQLASLLQKVVDTIK